MSKAIQQILSILLVFILISCGSSTTKSSSDNNVTDNNTTIQKGTVYDDVVVGLDYQTKDFIGKTDNNGQFNYKEGEVRFYLGTMFLGSIPTMPDDNKVFLSDILNLPRGTLDNEKLIKLAQTLQSLDTTPPYDEKIVLDKTQVKKIFSTPNQSIEDFTLDTLAKNGITIVTKEEAIQRVKTTYTNENITPIEPELKPKPTPEPKPQPTPTNQPPKANAGEDKTIELNTNFTLDGSNSTDEDIPNLLYEWFFNTNKISNSKTHTITPSHLGTFIYTLKVTDTKNLSDTDTITITVEDTTPPTITDINLENNQTNVSTDSNITITFSEELNTSSLTKTNLSINHNLNYTISTEDNKTITISPNPSFDENQTYTLTIKDIQDTSGNKLIDTNTTKFATADETSPTITNIAPQNNALHVSTDSNITITFSEELNTSSLTKTNLSINNSLDYNITTEDNKTITISPNPKFDENQTYTLTIKDIQDTSGNKLTDTNTTTFTTADETSPTITDINLDNNSLHVSIDEIFNISFSEELNNSTQIKDNFILKQDDTPITISFTKNENNVTIKPNSSLDFNTTYTLTIKNIEDTSGNKLTTKTYTFTTQERYYISQDGTGDGTTWTNALSTSKLQDTIDKLKDKNISIWFKKGVYKLANTIDIKNSVKLYGGFEGNETTLSQRVLTKENNTTLSGDNKIRVLKALHVNNNTILDGFYVVDGNVTSGRGGGMLNSDSNITISNVTFSGNSASLGGGMSNENSNPILTNVTFSGNSAILGGGMSNENSNPTLTNIAFIGNSTSSFGGGMVNKNSNPILTNVTFSGNSADGYGGGMGNYESNPILTNVTFSGNSAGIAGGMYNDNSNPTLTNIAFIGNSTLSYGGGMLNDNSNLTLTNVTFSENSASDGGGGMYNDNSNLTLTNTIIWGNTANQSASIHNSNSNSLNITHSIIQDLNLTNPLYKDKNNSIQNPLLTKKEKVVNGVTHTYYELGTNSPALNSGNNAANTQEFDQIGNKRVENSQIDIGSTEMPEQDPYIVSSNLMGDFINQDENLTIRFSEPLKFILKLNSSSFTTFTLKDHNKTLVIDKANLKNENTLTLIATDDQNNTLNKNFNINKKVVFYVATSTSGSGDGSSWANASNNLQTAINNQDIVWVKKGTYTLTNTIEIKNNVKLYGGFNGDETSLNQRVLTKENNTTLSGDNKIRVLKALHVNKNTILDGFYVVDGNVTENNENGAGMLNNDSNITIANVTFSENSAGFGGGMYNNNSNLTLTNVIFSENSALISGGGMLNKDSNLTLANVAFSKSSARLGGGMYSGDSNLTLKNIIFSENSADRGGGMLNGRSSLALTNVIFSKNSAEDGGGMLNGRSNLTLTNVTFSKNRAENGGGMYNYHSEPTQINVTFSGNIASNGPKVYIDNSIPQE